MNIYLVRHGDAEKSSMNKRDSERELTPEGKIITKAASAAWKNLIPEIDLIISSPYIRAYQTAEIIASVLGVKNQIVKDKKLSPGSNTESLVEIAQNYSSGNIMFVGHQPDFSEHLANLVSGSGAYFEFRKSAVAGIAFSNKVKLGRGTLMFLIPPDVFA